MGIVISKNVNECQEKQTTDKDGLSCLINKNMDKILRLHASIQKQQWKNVRLNDKINKQQFCSIFSVPPEKQQSEFEVGCFLVISFLLL